LLDFLGRAAGRPRAAARALAADALGRRGLLLGLGPQPRLGLLQQAASDRLADGADRLDLGRVDLRRASLGAAARLGRAGLDLPFDAAAVRSARRLVGGGDGGAL